MTEAMKAAVKWLRDRGGECAVARTKAGGRIYLAQGDTGPFAVTTARKLVEAGLAQYVDKFGVKVPPIAKAGVRFRLIARAQSPAAMPDSTTDGAGYVA